MGLNLAAGHSFHLRTKKPTYGVGPWAGNVEVLHCTRIIVPARNDAVGNLFQQSLATSSHSLDQIFLITKTTSEKIEYGGCTGLAVFKGVSRLFERV